MSAKSNTQRAPVSCPPLHPKASSNPLDQMRYRNDPYNGQGFVPVETHGPKFSRVSFDDFPAEVSPATDTTKPLREICLGQVPFFLNESTLTGFLRYVAPESKIHRTVIMEGTNGRRRGLCFVTLEDNGAVEKLFSLNKRVWFTEDRKNVLLAMNKEAIQSLEDLQTERRTHLTTKGRGDGLPMGALTVEFSKAKPKTVKHLSHAAQPKGASTPGSAKPQPKPKVDLPHMLTLSGLPSRSESFNHLIRGKSLPMLPVVSHPPSFYLPNHSSFLLPPGSLAATEESWNGDAGVASSRASTPAVPHGI